MHADHEQPLAGIKIVEFAGIGPGPFAAMMLGGLGASVIRVERPQQADSGSHLPEGRFDILGRDRESIILDLRVNDAVEVAKKLVERADGLIEGFRPGVMERLGLGPDVMMGINPLLSYVRVTGWGQDGPLSRTAGHDLNYIAITGILSAIGPTEFPVIPLNVVGDFGGGATFAVIGMLAALIRAKTQGKGSVVDSAIVDGTLLLGAMFHGMIAAGGWEVLRSSNVLDGGAPFYAIYKCRDGRFVTVAALENKFYRILLDKLGLTGDPVFADQYDRRSWPQMGVALSREFAERDLDELVGIFEGSDGCVAPVEDFLGARQNEHLRYRGVFEEIDGVFHPRPAPRFQGISSPKITPAPFPGQHSREILESLGYSARKISHLESCGALG